MAPWDALNADYFDAARLLNARYETDVRCLQMAITLCAPFFIIAPIVVILGCYPGKQRQYSEFRDETMQKLVATHRQPFLDAGLNLAFRDAVAPFPFTEEKVHVPHQPRSHPCLSSDRCSRQALSPGPSPTPLPSPSPSPSPSHLRPHPHPRPRPRTLKPCCGPCCGPGGTWCMEEKSYDIPYSGPALVFTLVDSNTPDSAI